MYEHDGLIMKRVKLFAGLILVLLVGAFAGALGTGIYVKHRIEKSLFPPPPHMRTVFLMNRLSEELDLTDAQLMEIERIVEACESETFSLRRQFEPRIRETVDRAFDSMKATLTPAQIEKLNRFQRRFRERHSRAFLHSILSEQTAERILGHMKHRLFLSKAQYRKARGIIEDGVKKWKEIARSHDRPGHVEFFAVRREIRELERSVEKRLSEVFSREQMRNYRKILMELHRDERVKGSKDPRVQGD
jgi:hypothetical protein